MDEKVGFHESGMWLPIKIGKLDISATLADAATALKGQSVGVYVAGNIIESLESIAWHVGCGDMLMLSGSAFA